MQPTARPTFRSVRGFQCGFPVQRVYSGCAPERLNPSAFWWVVHPRMSDRMVYRTLARHCAVRYVGGYRCAQALGGSASWRGRSPLGEISDYNAPKKGHLVIGTELHSNSEYGVLACFRMCASLLSPARSLLTGVFQLLRFLQISTSTVRSRVRCADRKFKWPHRPTFIAARRPFAWSTSVAAAPNSPHGEPNHASHTKPAVSLHKAAVRLP